MFPLNVVLLYIAFVFHMTRVNLKYLNLHICPIVCNLVLNGITHILELLIRKFPDVFEILDGFPDAVNPFDQWKMSIRQV